MMGLLGEKWGFPIFSMWGIVTFGFSIWKSYRNFL